DKVGRPTIGSIFPTSGEMTMVYDVGASVDCKPMHLYQYAIMGSMYMNIMYGINNPTVGLLNVGEEKSKGDELTIKTYELLEKSKLNFIGNIEGRDILKGNCNVVICDGFVGNVILKFAESVLDFLKDSFRSYADESLMKKVKVGLMKGTMKDILQRFDYQKYGGVPLLGVKGISIIGHGKSSPLAIKNMIMKAVEVYKKDVIKSIENELKSINF
ncbi:MAG TPA: phosphate acyltransferase PlsX, partial [Ignavibacteria bacterium]|nr:phosphate acyltransferase PlsX [Ignavibacteria bacterium]